MSRPRKENAFEYPVMTALDRADRKYVADMAIKQKCSMSQLIRSMITASREAYEQHLQVEQQRHWQQMAMMQQARNV
jgi:hypothetical protein